MDDLDTNLHGNVHGGVIMKLADDVAGAVAARHTGGRAVTVAMDEMVFLVPVHVGDLVYATAQVNWAGRTSVEVGVRIVAERWDETGQQPRHVASAYVVYVGIDEEEKPREVPPVQLETAEDERRFREAEIRRANRLARREAILSARGCQATNPKVPVLERFSSVGAATRGPTTHGLRQVRQRPGRPAT